MSDIKVGDKVRITFEDTVTSVGDDGRIFVDLDTDDCEDDLDMEVGYLVGDDAVSIEVTEKAVVTFKPGDVVRHRHCATLVYTVGAGGHLAHHAGFAWRVDNFGFTSEHYELVELHESPL
ncbi:MAG TPA: hypothetical protein VJW23_10055 [Propionibacteriaceae bacterium]|nr:hypothetical protein [Propionibacteriaceae bacterium]